jgi:hypothetical protein
MRLRSLLLVAALVLARDAAASIQLTQLTSGGAANLVGIEHAGDSRLFLVSQTGHIRIFDGKTVLTTPFLDVSDLLSSGGERGLLGLAFHPDYTSNGVFFINYTDEAGDITVARYVASPPSSNVADAETGQIVLSVAHRTYANHNGGQIRFGPDGYLYIATGDGGSGGDPDNNGQSLDSLLGKILRIDVDGGSPYAIPASNPFQDTPGARPEIWSYGLRNPWRFSFDRATGDMFIADVGQGLWEEINFEAAGAGGRNYGRRRMEGTHCYTPATNCNTGSLVLPIVEYPHGPSGQMGCSVTGGFRSRGATLVAHIGTYFFADYCTGRIWGATPNGDGSWTAVQLLDTSHLIATFGEDSAGNLYVGNYAPGALYRIDAAAAVSRLSITKSGNGTGVVESAPLAIYCGTLCGLEANGSKFTLSVTADPGTTFVEWSGDADCADGSIALTANRSCVANLSSPGAFTDESLTTSVTPVRAVHITELRTRVDAQRVRFKLQPFSWTGEPLSAGNSVILATHVTEMRSALAQAYAAAGQMAPQYTDGSLAAGDLIQAVHILELRAAVRGLE